MPWVQHMNPDRLKLFRKSQMEGANTGIERLANPVLQLKDKKEFISQVAKELERPPYFTRMERFNMKGAPILGNLPHPLPLNAKEFKTRAKDAVVVDTRMELGFSASHVPGALSI